MHENSRLVLNLDNSSKVFIQYVNNESEIALYDDSLGGHQVTAFLEYDRVRLADILEYQCEFSIEISKIN